MSGKSLWVLSMRIRSEVFCARTLFSLEEAIPEQGAFQIDTILNRDHPAPKWKGASLVVTLLTV
jgi:hypothetical protein